MVFVFIWKTKVRDDDEVDIGHGAMSLTKHGSYVSNWPGGWTAIIFGKGQPAPDFESDKKSEGGLPQLIYKIEGLDEDAMAARWSEMKKDLRYSFPSYNCFTTVAEVIASGMSFTQGILGDTLIPHDYVIAHGLLITFVHQVQLALKGTAAKNLTNPGSL